MKLFNFINARMKNLTWVDMAFTKIAVMAFILTVAKLWPNLLILDWYYYAIIWIVFAIKPIYKMFEK